MVEEKRGHSMSDWENLPAEYFQEVERLKRDMPLLTEDELVKRIVEIMLKYNAMPKALKGFNAVKIVEENRRECSTVGKPPHGVGRSTRACEELGFRERILRFFPTVFQPRHGKEAGGAILEPGKLF
jgi:hypothetical protein